MTLRKKLMPLYLLNRGMALASAYDLIYNVCGMLGALLGPISGLYLVSYLFEHKTEVDMVDMYKEEGGKYYYSKGFNVPIIIIFVAAMIIIFAGKYIAPLKFIFDNAYVVGSIGAGLAYFIYIKAAKRGQKQHSSSTKITAAMESIDCGRSITETKRGVEVS